MQTTSRAVPWIAWLTVGMALSAYGWNDHTLGSYPALAVMAEMAGAPAVQAESLQHFLAAEQDALTVVLRDEEAWARANVPRYPPRPGALAFRPADTPEALAGRFLAALRMNPRSSTALFVEPRFGSDVSGEDVLGSEEVTFLKTLRFDHPFVRLHEGDEVAPLEIVATASDEPDHGMDIGLWEDNGTDFGRRYGLGRQPFGNPVLEYSSQAPFHMGFYHEAAVVVAVAPGLKRTFPEVRIHELMTLARLAFRTGHDYWGWRFAGWGLHYVQDLTQPYHARVLPGVSTARVLWAGTLAAIGKDRAERDLRQLVTNRHLALEDYARRALEAASRSGRASAPLLAALADRTSDVRSGRFTIASVRGSLTRDSAASADATDAALRRWLPARIVDDPAYVFGQTEPDVDTLAAVDAAGALARTAMRAMLRRLLRAFGTSSRAYLRAVLTTAPPDGEAP